MTERVSTLPWIGLGAMKHERDFGDDATIIDDIERVLVTLTPAKRRCLLAMLHNTGACVRPSDRVHAHAVRTRHAMPPLWRMRLAVRRTGWTPPTT